MSRQMPKQRPGKSEQTVRTPTELLLAVQRLLGIDEFYRDLAASPKNAVADAYYTVHENALACSWRTPETAWNWLNPPYDNIAPWVERASLKRHSANTVVLIPASVGSNWWRDFVHKDAMVFFLNGRPVFLDKDGKPIRSPKTGKPTPYPKDLALLLYSEDWEPRYEVWDWRNE